jgi:hypothetical protein
MPEKKRIPNHEMKKNNPQPPYSFSGSRREFMKLTTVAAGLMVLPELPVFAGPFSFSISIADPTALSKVSTIPLQTGWQIYLKLESLTRMCNSILLSPNDIQGKLIITVN